MKRLLNCTASDFKTMNGRQLIEAIQASEGRVVLSEVIPSFQPLFRETTNMELAAAFGADLLLLNLFDVFNPKVTGLDEEPDQLVRKIKHLTGRPIGINLEPIRSAGTDTGLDQLSEGRKASSESIEKAKEHGFNFICFTGNPNTGVSNEAIIESVKTAKEIVGDELFLIAGKMHGAGVSMESGSGIIDEQTIKKLVAAGADVILLPSPGTVPGISIEETRKWISYIHQHRRLALLAIGTSQEGADPATINQIALQNKMAGADIHHIGDAGYNGIAPPENIMSYSIAIRGKRHTYIRMAQSINR